MKTKLIIIFSIFASQFVYGEAPKMVFEQNKNQWPQQVKYEADIPGGKLFLEQNTFTYLSLENHNFHDFKRGNTAPVTLHYHSYKVNFENSNKNVEVTGNDRFEWHRNYYLGNDPKKWADNVPVFGEVYYKNLYANVDMKV